MIFPLFQSEELFQKADFLLVLCGFSGKLRVKIKNNLEEDKGGQVEGVICAVCVERLKEPECFSI